MTEYKQYFTEDEAFKHIRYMVEQEVYGTKDDLQFLVFDGNDYLSDLEEAKEALFQYDVFKAIEKVVEYEKKQYGEILTEIQDPIKLANVLFHAVGEDAFDKLEESGKLMLNDENRQEVIALIDEFIGY